mgnify:CR=1 FL=1
MRITKRQLRRIIREACGLETSDQDHDTQHVAGQEVPSPEDYGAARQFMDQNPDLVDLGISIVMDLAGTRCERSTAQAIIDHLQEMLHGSAEEELSFADNIEQLLGADPLGVGHEAINGGL